MDFKLDVVEETGKVQAILQGEIDAYTAPVLREQLDGITISEGTQVELNFSNVNYMDSTGLSVIVAFYKSVVANGGEIVLTCLSERLKRLFDITGLTDIMNIEVRKVISNNERI